MVQPKTTEMKIYTETKKILNDLYTPVSAFLSLRDRYASVSVFESSTYHLKVNSKSFIGIDPIVTITVQNKELRSSINGESITDACADIETLEKQNIRMIVSLNKDKIFITLLHEFYSHIV